MRTKTEIDRMRFVGVGLGVLAAAGILVGGISLGGVALANATPAVGEVVPDLPLLDETGAEHKLSQYRGKVVVLEWTNPDCPYVQRHYRAKTMHRLSEKFAAKEVVWLAVNSTYYNDPEDSVAWKERQGFAFNTLQDKDGRLGHLLGAKTTPHMFVIDPEGKLAYKGAIDDDPRGRKDEVNNYVDGAAGSLLSGALPAPSSTQPYGCSVKYAD